MTEQTQTETAAKRGNRKQRKGVVVKAAAQKTVVVEVRRRVRHPRYHKFISRKQKFSVHDLIGCEVGDRVLIGETRPMSKTKRWRVIQKLTKDA